MFDCETRTKFDVYVSNIKDIHKTINYINALNELNDISLNNINKMIMNRLQEPYILHPSIYLTPESLLTNFVDMRVWLNQFCIYYGYNISITSDFIIMMKHMKESEKIYKHLINNQAYVHKNDFLMMIKNLLS